MTQAHVSEREGEVLPDCMAPDGAEPCKGYQQLYAKYLTQAELQKHRAEIEKFVEPYKDVPDLGFSRAEVLAVASFKHIMSSVSAFRRLLKGEG